MGWCGKDQLRGLPVIVRDGHLEEGNIWPPQKCFLHNKNNNGGRSLPQSSKSPLLSFFWFLASYLFVGFLFVFFVFFFLFFCFGHPHGMQKFLGLGLNLSHSSDPRHSTESLTSSPPENSSFIFIWISFYLSHFTAGEEEIFLHWTSKCWWTLGTCPEQNSNFSLKAAFYVSKNGRGDHLLKPGVILEIPAPSLSYPVHQHVLPIPALQTVCSP